MSDKKMKLSTKIYVGFGSVLTIMVVLGLLAITNMSKIKTESQRLHDANVPEVVVANSVERTSFHTMYANRGFIYTEEKRFQDEVKVNLEKVKEEVNKAIELGKSSEHLAGLEKNALAASEGVKKYEELFKKAEHAIEGLHQDREHLNTNAGAYMKNIGDYLHSQNEKMKEEVTDGKGKDKLIDRFQKTIWANEIVEYGNAVRIAVWKSQSLRDPAVIKDALPNFDKIHDTLGLLIKNSKDSANIEQLNKVQESGDIYKKSMLGLLANWEELQKIAGEMREQGEAVLKLAQDTATQGVSETEQVAELAVSIVNRSLFILIIGLLVGVAVGAVLAWTITSNIGNAMNRAIGELKSSSTQIMSATGQLSSAAQQLSSSSNEQASSVEETSSSLEELSGMVENNIGSAEQAFELSNKVKEKSENANSTMEKLKESMKEILASNEKIEALVKVISNIGEKTQVMDEIVFQTKLLSFNASVEAERAGEHGRGFAVVAQEVGNLAQMSGQAAQEIAQIVKNSITEAAAITTENKKKVDMGSEFVKQTAESLTEIMRSAQTVANGASQVLNASKDQSKGIKQINTAMGQVDKATQENASTAEETASASEELAAQVETLNRIVQDMVVLIHGAVDENMRMSINTNTSAHHSHNSHNPNVLKFNKKLEAAKEESAHAPTTAPKVVGSDVAAAPTASGGDEWEKL